MEYAYSLTPHEEAHVLEVGYQRQKPYLGDPTKNVNYSEGDVWEMWQHAVCAGAELAFARMIGDYNFLPHYNKWKTELDIPGFGEIRYSLNPDNGMRYTSRDDDELVYVLITNGLVHKTRRVAPNWKGPEYTAVGWMYGKECKRDLWKFNQTTWYVPQQCLRSMDTLSLSLTTEVING
jgi:hypothetical protein